MFFTSPDDNVIADDCSDFVKYYEILCGNNTTLIINHLSNCNQTKLLFLSMNQNMKCTLCLKTAYLDNYCSNTTFLKGFKSPVKAEDVFENAGGTIKEEFAGAQRERVAKCEDLS